jgi:hypothetical protein
MGKHMKKLTISLFTTIFLVTMVLSTYVLAQQTDYLRIIPKEEGISIPDLAETLKKLKVAVKTRDAKSIHDLMADDIRLSLGTSPNNITDLNLINPESAVWLDLEKLVSLPGAFINTNGERKYYCLPYVFSLWPQDIDPDHNSALVMPNVPVHSSPSDTSVILASLDYAIVKTRDPWATPWVEIEINNIKGYVKTNYVWNPIDNRLCFMNIGGEWLIRWFLGGD